MSQSLLGLLDDAARIWGGAPALLAPHHHPLSYTALASIVREMGEALRERGIGRGDRVAIVLPNGPAMAAAFLGIASHAAAAPLNPALREAEVGFALRDLGARALVTSPDLDTPARRVALAQGIPLFDLIASGNTFALRGDGGPPSPDGAAEPHDEALVLHTSGTTARPKQIPLSHRNIVSSATSIQQWLGLSPADRCLNVMPLFHIHGLVAALTASLAGGASVVCTPGFVAPRFFEWMDAFGPTWYTAVPTMHQAVLERAPADAAERFGLRFVRSSSASLPPRVLADLERTFCAPVVEAYGMTEATHQMTSNPLPPAVRKPGTVGVPAGSDVAILDAGGAASRRA